MKKDITTIIIPVNTELLDKALDRLEFDFKTPVSMAAMVRMLLGLYGNGDVMAHPEDVKNYSPQSYRKRKDGIE